MMAAKIQDLARYFGEKLNDDGTSYVGETFGILRSLRHSLIKDYKIMPKKPPVKSKKVKFSKAPPSVKSITSTDICGESIHFKSVQCTIRELYCHTISTDFDEE